MHTDEHLVEQVNKIIQTNVDRRQGYEKAIDEIKDDSLKDLFADCCRQSNEYVNELRQIIMQRGGTPLESTSAAGDLYRIWMDIKAAMAANNTKAVLQSCERGEDIALNAYKEVTEEAGQPADSPVQVTLQRQQEGILSMHNRVKALRDMQ